MARTKGAKGKLGVDLRDKISHAFDTVNGPNNAGLIALSKSDPAIFYGLVSRCIPADVSHNVTIALVSLGDAMQAAQARLEGMQDTMIDVTPSEDGTRRVRQVCDNDS